MKGVPPLVANRIWWLVPLLVWALAVAGSLFIHLTDLHRQSMAVATEGARNMFRMVVLVRGWNAEHGPVYVPVSPKVQPNHYLDHPRRDLTTTDNQSLTMVNPAYMTRLLAELAESKGGAVFHITSLNPIRPKNAPDDWERLALADFEQGAKERVDVVPGGDGGRLLRYMAPLFVEKACLSCHEQQGYRLGEVRGGISITQSYAPVAAATRAGEWQSYAIHGAVFFLVALAGGWLLELLRRRWAMLTTTIDTLEMTRGQLEGSNASLAQALSTAAVASRAKDEFLSVMRHELRTPLHAIAGYSQLLRLDSTNEQREMIGRIETASDDLTAMIDEMLDYSLLGSGGQKIVEVDFSLDDMLSKLFAALRKGCETKGLVCSLERDPQLPDWLRGDAARIVQLVGCYISNAVKFSERGEITLSARSVSADEPGRRRVRFEVADQGAGIGAEQQVALFQSFGRVDRNSPRIVVGAGVGLALCRRLADLLGGDVGVSSVQGEGSRFWFEVTLLEGKAQ